MRITPKILLWMLGSGIVVGAAGYVAFQVSPWPSAFFYRTLMDREGETAHQALEPHVPMGVTALLDQPYDAADRDASLDMFHPDQAAPTGQLPTIVWVHGGGWLSGSRGQISNYLRILAAKGYTTVGVDYTLAPGGKLSDPGSAGQCGAGLPDDGRTTSESRSLAVCVGRRLCRRADRRAGGEPY